MEIKICPYYMKYCDSNEDEYAVCDLSSVYPRQTEEMFDTPFGSMKHKCGNSDDPTINALFDSRAIKPEKYAELREQDFDTWIDTILHEIIEQVNFDAEEVDMLGDAVWNGECPDGSPYPRECKREDAYIQCIRQSNQLDGFMKNVDITVNSLNAKYELLDDKIHHLKDLFQDLETQINDLSTQLDELKKFIGYHFADPAINSHVGCDFCGNCAHYTRPKTPATVPVCDLSGEVIDPDDASCCMFEFPF